MDIKVKGVTVIGKSDNYIFDGDDIDNGFLTENKDCWKLVRDGSFVNVFYKDNISMLFYEKDNRP